MKLKKLESELKKIKFSDGENNTNQYGMDNFSSFLKMTEDYPLEEQINEKFPNNKKVTPNGLIKEGLIKKESFQLPSDFFNGDEFERDYMFVGLNAASRVGVSDYSDWKNFHDVTNPTNTFKLYGLISNERFNDRVDGNKLIGSYITDIIKSFVDSDSGNVIRNFFLESEELSLLKHPGDNQELDSKRASKLSAWQDSYQKKLRESEYKKIEKAIEIVSEAFIEDRTFDEPYVYKFDYKKKLTGEQILKKHKEILRESINCFVQECLLVRPKKIIVFGQKAALVLDEIGNSDLLDDILSEGEYSEDDSNYIREKIIKEKIQISHYSAYNVKGNKGVLSFRNWVEEASKELAEKL